MSGRYSHFRGGDGRQEPRRHISSKTVMTQALMGARPGNRGMELAAGLSQVDGSTIAKALVDEKALREKMEGLSRTNPERSKKIRIAGKVDKFADPMMILPATAIAGLCFFLNPIAGIAAVGLVPVVLLSASIWASRVKMREEPKEDGLKDAKKQLADAAWAKAELCAKTGLGERFVELLQALPLDVSQKHTVLKQAIFQDVPEDYVVRVAGILKGISARGEDLKEFASRRLEYISRDISQAQELAEGAEKRAAAGDKEQAFGLFEGSGKALERALDYAGAAGMYHKASDIILADKKRAAELSGKAGDCYLKAGDRAAARERYEWASMIVGKVDPGLSSEFQGKAVTLI